MLRRLLLHVGLVATIATLAGARAEAAPAADARDTAIVAIPPVIVIAVRPRATAGGSSALAAALDSGRARPAPTLEQILREMPLVVIRANSRGEAQPALRGADDRQIAVLVDGIPITLAWDHRSDLSMIPLTAARSVTLHRGLSSLLTGPNALGGAVEVEISAGRRADTPPPALVVDAGVDHTGGRSAALAAGAQRPAAGGVWTMRAGAGYRGTDGFALARPLSRTDPATRARLTADGDRRLNTDAQALDAFVSLRRSSERGAWGSLTGMGYRLERGVAPEAHTTAPRLWRYPFQARGFGVLASGTGTRPTPWGRGDLEASLGMDVGRSEIDEYGALDYLSVVGGERDDDHTFTARVLGDHTLGERGDLRTALTFADVSHDEAIAGNPPASYRQRLWSLATETEWRIQTGAPVRLSAGAAADGADTPESSDKPPLARLWDWGGRLGATAVFRDGRLLVHAGGSHRGRFPSLRELYSGALGRFLESPGLGPETQWSSELGLAVRQARSGFEVVGFHQVLEDAIARVAVVTATGNRFRRVNQGRVTASGVEMLGDAVAGAFAFGADLTLQRVRSLDASGAGIEVEYEPSAFGGAWCEAPLPGRARIAIAAHATSEQRFVDLDRGALATLAPSVRFDVRLARGFDLGAGADPWRRLDIVIALENAADQAVFDQAGLPLPGRTFRAQARLW